MPALLRVPLCYPPRMSGHDATSGQATRLLKAVRDGGEDRLGELLELVYGELRRLAEQAMAGERPQHTLQPTALVHEAWLRLFEGQPLDFQDRRHLLTVSARAMRRILVDHARARRRAKRGGGWARSELDVEAVPAPESSEPLDGTDLIALEGALQQLGQVAPRAAHVVELRYFGGFSVEDAALALEASESTVAREWRFARAWLMRRLEPGAEPPGAP